MKSEFFCIMFLFSLVLIVPFGSCYNHLPKIEVNKLKPEYWHSIIYSGENRRPIFFANGIGAELFLSCTSLHPILWNITGIITPKDIVKYLPPTKHWISNKYEIELRLYFFHGRNSSSLEASARISCHKVGSPAESDYVYVYVMGNSKSSLILSQNLLTDTNVVPCLTKNPLILPPKLFKIENTADFESFEITDVDVTYVPYEGFYSAYIFNGTYECRQENSKALFYSLSSTNSPATEFIIKPIRSHVIAFTDTSIKFECWSSNPAPLRLIVEDQNTTNIGIVFDRNDFGMNATISSNTIHGVPFNIMGRLSCHIDNNNGSTVTLKSWTFEFVETPQIYFDNYAGEIYCMSNSTYKIIQSVKCLNSMHCQFMKSCLQNETSCNFKVQRQFYSKQAAKCWMRKQNYVGKCVHLVSTQYNGIIQCGVSGQGKVWEFFTSLDLLKYNDWRDAPTTGLIRMDETPPVLYTNNTVQLVCTVAYYLFTNSIYFKLKFFNGTMTTLGHDTHTVNVTIADSSNERKIDRLNFIGILDIKLPIEAVEVHCCAPWWNSTEEMTTFRKFETKHLLKPRIKSNENLERSEPFETKTFYTGDQSRRLSCEAIAEPPPLYYWMFGNTNVSTIFPELTTSTGSLGEGHLDFHQIGTLDSAMQYSGIFTCVAYNMIGLTEKSFRVEIEDSPDSSHNIIYVAVGSTLLVVLAVVVCIFAVFLKRYYETKKLLRSLTDAEVNEFFQGNPDLIASSNATANVDLVEFQPYDRSFEIPLSDLEFDQSPTSYLGKGMFSYVVKAKMHTANKFVALKISTTSADVTMFKSLLSEVKVMIYIGNHENVVSLIGVCTEKIQSRTIYIATDICNRGSLENLLREEKHQFLNLLDTSEKLNIASFQSIQHAGNLNTLDLLSFCSQIAAGMEFLASKSVIHADLAARNVLITSQNVAKVSDFGMSKKLYESTNYIKKSKMPLPWRWMAIESLSSLTFSVKSDVWAFGITVFEIFSLGDIPFPHEVWSNDFLERLKNGYRVDRPKHCTNEIYSHIYLCWERDPELRPTFLHLREFFSNLLEGYLDELRALDGMQSETAATPNKYYENIFHNQNLETVHSMPSSRYTNI